LNEDQLKAFPESVQDWDEIKNSDTPEVAWDRLGNMRKKFGTALFQPGENAGTEDWGKFSEKAVALSDGRLMPRPDLEDADQRNALYKTLGRPDKAEDYEFSEVEGAQVHDDSRAAFLKKMAFEANLTKDQLKQIDMTVRQADVVRMQENQTAQENAMKSLKQEWGLATDDRLHGALKIAKTFFPHLGDDPTLTADEFKAFNSLAKQLGGSSTEFSSQGNQSVNAMSPNEAAEKIADMRNNPKHAYYDKTAFGHQAARDQMHKLYKIKNGIAVD